MKNSDLLSEVLLYEFQKKNYTKEEQEILKKDFLKKCKQKLKDLDVSYEHIINNTSN